MVPEAVLRHVDVALPAGLSEFGQRLRAVSQLRDRAGAVPVEEDVGGGEEGFESETPRRGLQVEVGGVFGHVAVDLEKGDVGEGGGGDLQDGGTVFSEDFADGGARDDPAEFEDEDPGEGAGGGGGGARGKGGGWGTGFEGGYLPRGKGGGDLPVGGGEEGGVRHAFDAGLVVGGVEDFEFGDGEFLDVGFDGGDDGGH